VEVTPGLPANPENNILLYAVPSSANIINTASGYVASSMGHIITKTESTLEFVLDAAKYEVTNTGTAFTAAAKPNTGSGTAIQLGGYVNSRANWSDFTGSSASKTAGVDALFSFARASQGDIDAAKDLEVPGMMASARTNSLEVPLPVGFMGTADPKVLNVVVPDIGDTLNIMFNFGEYTELIVHNHNGSVQAPTNNYAFNAAAGTITFTASRTTSIKGLALPATYTFVVGGVDYTVNLLAEAPLPPGPPVTPLGFLNEVNPLQKTVSVASMPAATPYVIEFNFGSNTAVTVNNHNGNDQTATGNWSIDPAASTFTFVASRVTSIKGLATLPATYEIIMDGVTYTINFTA
jgi:hypothetical protein